MTNTDVVAQNTDIEHLADIWLRARHNAMAHNIAFGRSRCMARIWEILTAILIILPLISLSLSESVIFMKNAHPYFSVVGAVGALFLTLVGFVKDSNRERELHHQAHCMYNSIAQKCRRANSVSIEDKEKKYLIRSLEEMFEAAKSAGVEPTDEDFKAAMRRIKNMPRLPFGLIKEDL